MKKSIILFCAFLFSVSAKSQSENLYVFIGNVGQADAILIRDSLNMQEILIDAGGINQQYPQSRQLFETFISTYQDTANPIEYVIATHPHADHIGNMEFVFDNYHVVNYIDNGLEYTSATYRRIMEKMQTEPGLRYYAMHNGSEYFTINCTVKLEMFWPCEFDINKISNTNDGSVITKVTFDKNEFLFMGDCEEDIENMLLEDDECADKIKKVDFLKAGHHGSNTSSSEDFIKHVKPKFVAVSVGEKETGSNSRYKHPRLSAVTNLEKHAQNRDNPVFVEIYDSDQEKWINYEMNKNVFFTKTDGTIILRSNGRKILKL